jgi:hypothetical protein
MAYIGRDPLYGTFEKQVLVPNGTDTLFTLDYIAGSTTSLLVVSGGVVKNPDIDYILAEGGRKIQFVSAPSTSFYIIYLGKQYLVPSFSKTFTVRTLTGNLTIAAADITSILSLDPQAADRTVFIPIASELSGYELKIRNRSSTNNLIINAGTTVTTISPNSSKTIVSDSLSWFVSQ